MAKVGDVITFYCMKCKKKVKSKIEKMSKTKKGTTMNTGHCSCGTKLCIISK
jgi:hypothetical protein